MRPKNGDEPHIFGPPYDPQRGAMGMVFDIKNKKEIPFALRGSKGGLHFGYIAIIVI